MLLPSHSVVAVRGRDARTFLQGQLTNDLLGLERHPGMLAASCNRQGRVQATMRLAAQGEDVLLVLRRTLVPALVAELSRYVLRADLRIVDEGDRQQVAGLLDASPDSHGSQTAAAAAGLAMLVAGPRRLLLAGPTPSLDRALSAFARAPEADWELTGIADGEPVIHAETAALWIPQMLNLDLLSAVSFSKGCYVGQEIVARSQHLGRIKRRMLRYVGPAAVSLKPGQPLYAGDVRAAQVVVTSRSESGTECLAVVDLEFCSDLLGTAPGGLEWVPGDLPYTIPSPMLQAAD